VNLPDSSGWLEYFADAPNARPFAAVIEGDEPVVVPTIVLFEVGRRVWQQRGEDAAISAMEALGRFPVITLDPELAADAVRVAITHRLAMADSIIYATAQRLGATVWTQDSDFEGLPGVRYLPKP
jgi:toxin FitB